jgi:hypothetical protein
MNEVLLLIMANRSGYGGSILSRNYFTHEVNKKAAEAAFPLNP